jgi:hypothetical protein
MDHCQMSFNAFEFHAALGQQALEHGFNGGVGMSQEISHGLVLLDPTLVKPDGFSEALGWVCYCNFPVVDFMKAENQRRPVGFGRWKDQTTTF